MLPYLVIRKTEHGAKLKPPHLNLRLSGPEMDQTDAESEIKSHFFKTSLRVAFPPGRPDPDVGQTS